MSSPGLSNIYLLLLKIDLSIGFACPRYKSRIRLPFRGSCYYPRSLVLLQILINGAVGVVDTSALFPHLCIDNDTYALVMEKSPRGKMFNSGRKVIPNGQPSTLQSKYVNYSQEPEEIEIRGKHRGKSSNDY